MALLDNVVIPSLKMVKTFPINLYFSYYMKDGKTCNIILFIAALTVALVKYSYYYTKMIIQFPIVWIDYHHTIKLYCGWKSKFHYSVDIIKRTFIARI
jgi:hypothetical protein